MKLHELDFYEEHEVLFTGIPPSVLCRQGRYIFIIGEMDGIVDKVAIDKRRYKREAYRALRLRTKVSLHKYTLPVGISYTEGNPDGKC